MVEKVVIMGAAGRDFHNFNIYFRGQPAATGWWPSPPPRSRTSTAGAIPPSWPGRSIPEGIPIYPEGDLPRLHPRARGRSGGLLLQRRPPHRADAQGLPGHGGGRGLHPHGRHVHHAAHGKPGGGRLRGAHRLRQVPDHAAGSADPASRAGQAAWSSCATPCPTATWRRRRCSVSPPTRIWTSTTAPSRSGRSTSPCSDRGIVVYAGVDYARILRAGRRRRPTSSSGTGATTTCPSSARPAHRGLRPAPAPGTSCCTTPARPTCAWPTWRVINKVDSATAPAGRAGARQHRASTNPAAAIVLASSPRDVDDPGRGARAGGCWWWRMAPP